MVGIIISSKHDIIRMAPVVYEINDAGLNYFIVAPIDKPTDGFSELLSELSIDKRNITYRSNYLDIPRILAGKKCTMLLTVGNSTPTFMSAYYAKCAGFKVSHIDAGLRNKGSSSDNINNLLLDRLSDQLFSPTHYSTVNLLKECLGEKNMFVGSTIVSLVDDFSSVYRDREDHIVVLLSNKDNINNHRRLKTIVNKINSLSRKHKIVFICKSGSKSAFKGADLHVRVRNIISYERLIKKLVESYLVITDSGSIQEETCILKKRCLVISDNTDRIETLGLNARLCEPCNIVDKTERALSTTRMIDYEEHPYGHMAETKIIKTLF